MGAEEGGNLTIGTRGRGTEREEIMGVGKLREEDREMRTWERRTGGKTEGKRKREKDIARGKR